MAVSTNPLLFLTQYSQELQDEIAKDDSYDLDSYRVPTIISEDITIVTEVLEEFLIYFEEVGDPEVLRYNMRILGKRLDDFEQDAKLNAWDHKKTKNVFHEYENELKRINLLVKKGRAENPEKDEYDELQDALENLQKKCHQTKRSCIII